jgi:hypothetical protein
MSKRNQYEKDEVIEQNESGYYYPPVFRYPMDEDDSRKIPSTKKPLMDSYTMPGGPTGLVQGIGGLGGTAPAAPASMESGTLPGLGVIPQMSQMEPSVFDPGFLQAYLRKNIRKRVRIEFLIGTNILTDRTGTIEEVGISYVVLRDQAGSKLVCDLYSIKFITIYG